MLGPLTIVFLLSYFSSTYRSAHATPPRVAVREEDVTLVERLSSIARGVEEDGKMESKEEGQGSGDGGED